MTAVCIWQPCASACVRGTKRNETRNYTISPRLIGKRIAIHAAKRWQREEREWTDNLLYWGFDLGFEGTPPLGCIVGSVLLTGFCHAEALYAPDFAPVEDWNDPRMVEYQLGDYRPGLFAWMFTEPIQYEHPILWKGSLGLFQVPDWVDDPDARASYIDRDGKRLDQMVLEMEQ